MVVTVNMVMFHCITSLMAPTKQREYYPVPLEKNQTVMAIYIAMNLALKRWVWSKHSCGRNGHPNFAKNVSPYRGVL